MDLQPHNQNRPRTRLSIHITYSNIYTPIHAIDPKYLKSLHQ
ncbi:hypothetical protein F383_10121 [Gossypium arboreum]|uniref:Uncharacterized protein n=1 Tax=Gossypium arboreum TaxID=29729 RepID=A0A0B0PSJ9_GOSAR|nr:hypothetical protein F383_10121 [Gossypium arboreum]